MGGEKMWEIIGIDPVGLSIATAVIAVIAAWVIGESL
jgi:hypothetical protein